MSNQHLPNRYFYIGKILKSHGYQGQLKIYLLEELGELKQGDWLMIAFQKKPVPFFMESIEYLADDLAIVKLKDVENKEAAQSFVQHDLYLPDSKISKELQQALIIYQLKGFELLDQSEQQVGKIQEIQESAGQYLLSVSYKDEDVLIPYHNDLVHYIDQESKVIAMEIAEGLLPS